MSAAVDRVLAALESHGRRPKQNGHGWHFHCPCSIHRKGDRHASGYLGEGDDGKALVCCYAGGDAEDIVGPLGLDLSDLFSDSGATTTAPRASRRDTPTAIYTYPDETGRPLFRVLRFGEGPGKGFSQERFEDGRWIGGKGAMANVPRVVFRLPDVIATVADGGTVYICEGEKDCEAINALESSASFIATCNSGGAGKWRSEYNASLKGAHVVVVADKDEPGRRHALDVRSHLQAVAADLRIVEARHGHDAHDHLKGGGTLADFVPMPEPGEIVGPTRIECGWTSLSVRSALESSEPETSWFVPGYFAGNEATTYVADPKAGKSISLLAGCVQACVGRPFWGRFAVARPLRVLWGDEEMGVEKIRRRLKRLVAGLGLNADEIALLDEMLDIRPQQGFSFAADGALDELRRVMDARPTDLVVFDSLAAFQQGEENSATERRRFYNTVIAPIKSTYKCAVILPAHPPLPSQNAHPDSKKRVRGSGDVRAFVDRNFWMEKIATEKNEFGHVHTLIVNADLEREGGSQERQVLVLEDTTLDAMTCTAKGDYTSAEGVAVIGKANACQRELLFAVEKAGGRIYQPDLVKELESLGFKREHDYYPAVKALEALKRLKNTGAEKGCGKNGDWLELVESDHD